MKLSICTITYNQREFISQALNSFLTQQTNFNYEIIVADDCSTDGTRDILLQYESKYSEKIHLILQEKNVGMIKNFKTALEACKGQYVALCEGDDYWIDNQKLQKQVNLLDARPDIAISFHTAQIEFSGIEPFAFPNINEHTKEISTIEDLIQGNIMHTPTCVFRNHLFTKYPKAFMQLKLGDWLLHLLNAHKGNIHFMKDTMAVYRVQSNSSWSSLSHIKQVEYFLQAIKTAKTYFSPLYDSNFNMSIKNHSRYLLKLYKRKKMYNKLILYWPTFLVHSAYLKFKYFKKKN